MNKKENVNWAPTIPYTSLFIDASWWDFIDAAKECMPRRRKHQTPAELAGIQAEIESFFVTDQNSNAALACLSVRTAFDLFFRVQQFPAGCQVIMSAVNIPSMVDIVKEHGLVPIPWDVNPRTLTPCAKDLERLINEKTVVVVLAHLFGKRCSDEDVRRFSSIARKHGLFFIEDCAETFFGFGHLGDPMSDLILFSFGVIKYYTCFGGAVVKVQDKELYSRMATIYAEDPQMSDGEYLQKLAKYAFVALGLNVPTVVRYGVPFFRAIGVDHKIAAVGLLRGFPGEEMIRKIRRRPSNALLATMHRRLSSVVENEFASVQRKGEFVEKCLSCYGIDAPGCDLKSKNYWLFPIIVDNPEAIMRKLNVAGVDAFAKATQLGIVVDRENRTTTSTPKADAMLKHLVYLPVHKNVPYKFLIEICNAVQDCLDEKPTKSKL